MKLPPVRDLSTSLWAIALAAVLLVVAVARETAPAEASGAPTMPAIVHVLDGGDDGMDLAAARRAYDAGRFVPVQARRDGELNFGYRRAHVWLRLALPRPADDASRWFLQIAFPTLDRVEVFQPDAAGRFHMLRSGDLLPFGERPWPHRDHVFPLDFGARAELPVFIRVSSEGSLTIPLALVSQPALHRADQRIYAADAVYFGMLLGLLLFNLLLWLSLRETMYLRYVAFATSIGIAFAAQNGFGAQFLWPDLPAWGNLAFPLGMAAAGLFGTLFARSFLDTPRIVPRLDRLLVASIAAFALSLAAPWLASYRVAAMATSLSGLCFAAVAMVAAVQCLRRGHAGARYFLLAWLILLVGVAVMALRNFDWLPTTWLTTHAMQIGSALEMLLLSFAMADRINVLRQEREAARQATLDALRLSEQKLERRVAERTEELEAANRQLRVNELALQRLAFQDPLTGLANRAMLDDRLDGALRRAERARGKIAVLLVDIDGFKRVNDGYGHAVGDQVLVAAVRRMHEVLRACDTFARLGGDEFVVVIEPLGDEADAATVAGKLVTALGRPLGDDDGRPHRIGASIGIAIYPDDGTDGARLIRAADRAMYAAKASGKNRWRRNDERLPAREPDLHVQ